MKPMYVRHKARGGVYEHLGSGRLQTEIPLRDMDRVEVYRDVKDGRIWARRAAEFTDGRYEETGPPFKPVYRPTFMTWVAGLGMLVCTFILAVLVFELLRRWH